MYTNNYYDYGSPSCDCNWFSFLILIIFLVWFIIAMTIARYAGDKADKEGHSYALWAFLGFIFGLFALLALHIALTAEKSKQSFTLWAILGFLLGFTALIMLQTGLIAKRKNYDFTSYCLIGYIGGLFALLIVCFLPQKLLEVKTQNSKSDYVDTSEIREIWNKE